MPKEKKRADNVGSSRSSSRVEKKNTIKKGTEAQQDFQRMMEKLGEKAGLNVLTEPNREMFNKIFNKKNQKKLN